MMIAIIKSLGNYHCDTKLIIQVSHQEFLEILLLRMNILLHIIIIDD